MRYKGRLLHHFVSERDLRSDAIRVCRAEMSRFIEFYNSSKKIIRNRNKVAKRLRQHRVNEIQFSIRLNKRQLKAYFVLV